MVLSSNLVLSCWGVLVWDATTTHWFIIIITVASKKQWSTLYMHDCFWQGCSWFKVFSGTCFRRWRKHVWIFRANKICICRFAFARFARFARFAFAFAGHSGQIKSPGIFRWSLKVTQLIGTLVFFRTVLITSLKIHFVNKSKFVFKADDV